MFYKTCPKCGKTSNSLIEPRKWTCPYCSTDLSDAQLKNENEEFIDKTSEGIKRNIDSECAGGSCPVK